MSDVAGYLAPAALPSPLEDDALVDFLGDVVAAITGLDREEAVRPRWQEEPPALPDRAVTWCAVGVMEVLPDTYAHEETRGDGLSQDLARHEVLTVLASFYGPQAGRVGGLFRDGLQVAQNREELDAAGFGMVETRGPRSVPELIKEKWLSRMDLTWVVRREIRRNYPVLSLLSANGELVTTLGTVAFETS